MTDVSSSEASTPLGRAPFILFAAAVAALVAGVLVFALWPDAGGAVWRAAGHPVSRTDGEQAGGAAGAAAHGATGDILIIAKGQEVTLADHLATGKYTLIDFYADWCRNCQRLNPVLEELAGREPRLAIRKVNIISWDSPVARQFGLTALPHLILYGPQGERVAEGESVWQALERLPA